MPQDVTTDSINATNWLQSAPFRFQSKLKLTATIASSFDQARRSRLQERHVASQTWNVLLTRCCWAASIDPNGRRRATLLASADIGALLPAWKFQEYHGV